METTIMGYIGYIDYGYIGILLYNSDRGTIAWAFTRISTQGTGNPCGRAAGGHVEFNDSSLRQKNCKNLHPTS